MHVPEEILDWRTKGCWQPDGHLDRRALTAGRPSLFDGGFAWPVLTVRRSAVAANVSALAGFAAAHGFVLAPHAKTAMAPALIAAQQAAGAWGSTVATGHQALLLRRFEVERVLLANLVLDPTVLSWLAAEVQRGFSAYLQVDSIAGVTAAAAAAAGVGAAGAAAGAGGADGGVPVAVLVELGHAGGRTGARSLDELSAVAAAVAAAPGLRLAGVTGYEGGVPGGAGAVRGFLDRLAAAARLVAPHVVGELLVSAGGSAWFDLVVERLTADAVPAGARRVLRSGAYVTHDDGFYAERTPFTRVAGGLSPALAVWAQVLSTPEPGLAVVGMGKRDVSFDEGLPVALEVRAPDGSRRPAVGLTVTRLNDHHCYLDVAPGAHVDAGDLLRFGVSHPCTVFDKWRAVPVVEDDDTVSDVLHTYF